jgi:hypothetical protein
MKASKQHLHSLNIITLGCLAVSHRLSPCMDCRNVDDIEMTHDLEELV